jgi:transcriptional regulator with XRE-family HTH domain
MAFTENLNYCMTQKDYSAYRLSKIIGSTNQAVLNWQAGKAIPHVKTRQKIADHFGITLAELDGDELPVLPEKGAKKSALDPKTEGEGLSAAKKALLVAIDDLSDAQCEKLLPIVLSAKQVL